MTYKKKQQEGEESKTKNSVKESLATHPHLTSSSSKNMEDSSENRNRAGKDIMEDDGEYSELNGESMRRATDS